VQVIGQDNDGKLSVVAVAPQELAAAAALDSGVFRALNVEEAVPETWEERAKLAWEYYTEEPIVKNAVNAWRTFAIGDEVGFHCEDDGVEAEVREFAGRVGLDAFVRDMVLQLLVKGDCVGYKTYTEKGDDVAAVQCVNPVSVKLKVVQGELTEAKQFPEDSLGIGEGIDLPMEQLLHLKWDAPSFSPRGNSMVLPAFHAIALLRDYRKSESAIAKRWTTPLRFVQVGGQFGSKLVMPDQGMLDRVRKQAPAELASLWRAVTKADYVALAEGFPGVAKAQVLDVNDCINLDYYHVCVVIAPDGGGLPSQLLKDEVLAFLNERKLLTVTVHVKDPVYVPIDVDAEIHVFRNYNRFEVLDAALAKVRDALAFDCVRFGQDIYFSDLVALIDGVEGVSHVVMNHPTADVPIAAGELAVEGSTHISSVYVAE